MSKGDAGDGHCCVDCESADLRSGTVEQVIVVDGRKHKASLAATVCSSCGHHSVSGKELRRASDDIRVDRGEYSGRVLLRIPPELHQRLAEAAEAHEPQLSLNQLMLELLECGVGRGAVNAKTRTERATLLASFALDGAKYAEELQCLELDHRTIIGFLSGYLSNVDDAQAVTVEELAAAMCHGWWGRTNADVPSLDRQTALYAYLAAEARALRNREPGRED